jgi:hypothetical protein
MDVAAAPTKRRSSGKRKAKSLEPSGAEALDALSDLALQTARDAAPSAAVAVAAADVAHGGAETTAADQINIEAAPSEVSADASQAGEIAPLETERRASAAPNQPPVFHSPAAEPPRFEPAVNDTAAASLASSNDVSIDDVFNNDVAINDVAINDAAFNHSAVPADVGQSESTLAFGHADIEAVGSEAAGMAGAAGEEAARDDSVIEQVAFEHAAHEQGAPDDLGTQDGAAEDLASESRIAVDDGRGGPPSEPPSEPHDPHHRHGWVYLAMAVFALALLFGAWGMWTTWFAGDDGDAQDVASLNKATERLRQDVSTLRRSDQISRDANRDLQRTLAERDEEIAGLRADVAFYESFVGATGQRRGLSVHDLEMQLQSGEAWHFIATLTQNLNRGAVNTGRLTLSVEGTRNDRLERLPWTRLRQENNAPGTPYSFKYFQQLEGDVILPKDFKPVRVIVRLVPAGGNAVEQSFTWTDTLSQSTVR